MSKTFHCRTLTLSSEHDQLRTKKSSHAPDARHFDTLFSAIRLGNVAYHTIKTENQTRAFVIDLERIQNELPNSAGLFGQFLGQ